jgi:hypothetical protein
MMIKLNYDKEFLSGTLAGITVPQSATFPDGDSVTRFIEVMAKFTHAEPGADYQTGAKFVVRFTSSEGVEDKSSRVLTHAQSFAAQILDKLYEKYGVVGVGELSSVATPFDYDKAEYAARVIWGKEEVEN